MMGPNQKYPFQLDQTDTITVYREIRGT